MGTSHTFGMWFFMLLLKGYEMNGNPCSPCSCECHDVYLAPCLDCTNVNLSAISTFPSNFTEKVKTFSFLRKHEISLDNGIFYNFTNLQSLSVISSRFSPNQTLPPRVFQELKNLEQLYLHGNRIVNVSVDAFEGLWKLKRLYLGDNDIQNIIPRTFRNLPMLEMLELSMNKISSISENVFIGLKKLKILDLHKNRLHTIPYFTFRKLEMLDVLNLRGNGAMNISEPVFIGLGQLKVLDLSSNRLDIIPPHTFRRLGMLDSLDLSLNVISNISQNSLQGLMRLQSLSLVGNRIQNLTCHTFRPLSSLQHLDLSGNKISGISYCSFNGLLKLKSLLLRSNQLESLDNEFLKDLEYLERLDVRRNNISRIGEKSVLSLGNAKQILLTENNLRSIPQSFWITDLNDVIIHIDSNPFTCSCRLLNEIKQFQYKVNILIPAAKDFESQCSNISTTICEEERNFALGMKVGHNCIDTTYSNNFHSVYAITDGNVNTYAICSRPWWLIPKPCVLNLRINLPGVIVVTKVVLAINILYLTQNYRFKTTSFDDESNATLSVDVGDELSDVYEPCSKQGHILQSSLSDMTIFNISCFTAPTGRQVLVKVKFDENEYNQCKDCEINPHEITVNGYEENKFNIWSIWSKWGPCSEPCGSGVRSRYRNCTRSTSITCLLPGTITQRSLIHNDKETCYLKSCPNSQLLYQWTIGGVAAVFILILFGIIFWYRKFKMVTYFDGLWPNNNFEIDPDRTLLEQIEELPYDLHWEFPRYDVGFESVIGEGNFGRVWLAKAKGIKAFNPRDKSDLSSRAKLAKLQDQRVHQYFTTVTEAWVLGDCNTTHHYDVAVKTLKECATPKHKMDLASELKLLICMGQHPNVVNVLASCTIRGDLWIIMEYCDHGSLKAFLSHRQKNFNPSWSRQSADILHDICFFDLLQMCEQVVKGLMFLHCWKVVHRDISARNILLDANFNVKIADFGLARTDGFIASIDDIMPIKWTALESLLRHEYTTKSDIWSAGILFWEIFSLGEMPYPGISSREVIQQLKEGYRMNPPDHCPHEIWKIISACWDADPDHRPSAAELFEQLDEVKVRVSSAPAEQYYGTDNDCTNAGTIQGLSLQDIEELAQQKDDAVEDVSITFPKKLCVKQIIRDEEKGDVEVALQQVICTLDTQCESEHSTKVVDEEEF